MKSIEELIENASYDMFNPDLNFEIAKKYDELGQNAAAVSFYLRAAEYGYDSSSNVVYTSLIRISFCLENQTGREHTVSSALLQAIEYMPSRPEAYFLLSRFYERTQKWQECYTWAQVGLAYAARNESLPAETEYPGAYGFTFEKAVSGWWMGRKEESLILFNELLQKDIAENYRSTIEYNLKIMNPSAESQKEEK
jgi:tetratricopeptide (TPR) repeat protein